MTGALTGGGKGDTMKKTMDVHEAAGGAAPGLERKFHHEDWIGVGGRSSPDDFFQRVCDALLDGGVMVDYVIGVSAGIAYGVSYISRQPPPQPGDRDPGTPGTGGIWG